LSTAITIGAVILTVALTVMFFFSNLKLRTIAFRLAGIAIVYVGGVAWFSSALDAALKRRSPQTVNLDGPTFQGRSLDWWLS
jgi:uncharacterized SAM-binding protein YcdF (DUF218 family)